MFSGYVLYGAPPAPAPKCSLGCPGIQRSASLFLLGVLGLKACATAAWLRVCFEYCLISLGFEKELKVAIREV